MDVDACVETRNEFVESSFLYTDTWKEMGASRYWKHTLNLPLLAVRQKSNPTWAGPETPTHSLAILHSSQEEQPSLEKGLPFNHL